MGRSRGRYKVGRPPVCDRSWVSATGAFESNGGAAVSTARTPVAAPWAAAVDPHSRVLVIDDEQRNLDLMGRILERAGYTRVTLFTDPEAALRQLPDLAADLIVLDLHMPGIDGFEVLRRLRTALPGDDLLPRLVVTADATTETRRDALALGAHDFLTKPIDVTEVVLRVANLLRTRMLHLGLRASNDRLEEQVRARTRQLEDAHRDVTRRLALVGEYRDGGTGEHVERVAELAEALALAAGMPADRAAVLGQAALLHDIGKVAVPDAILLKAGPLLAAELAVIRTHPSIGAHILSGSRSPVLQLAEQIARTHHERWDGQGYPAGLEGEQIPLAGRLVGIVDVYDSLSSVRPYKAAWPRERVVSHLLGERGRQFDPALLDTFLASPAATGS